LAALVALPLLACGRPPGAVVSYLRADEGVVFHGPTAARVVALTIDDGPDARTPAILDLLAAHDARATFFLVAAHIAGNEATVRALLAQGHEIGHHMLHDTPTARQPAAVFEEHFLAAESILQAFQPCLRWFRPASARFNAHVLRTVRAHGYTPVLGDVYPLDAHIPSADFAANYILRNVRPGSILVLHEGGARAGRAMRALERVLPELRRRGYHVTTLSELLGPTAPARPACRDRTPPPPPS
jgi:peptidoglycan-N-acetylglucosamine deacetylase